MNLKTAGEVAKLLLQIKAVTFRFDPPYTFTSGIKSPMYLDNRLVISYPKVREKIINFHLEMIKREIGLDQVDWLSATATAAIPLGAWLADRLGLPLVYVRSSAKAHGKENQIEGTVESGKHVLVVEDHISTGESALGNAAAIRQAGGKVAFCVATTTYETRLATQNFQRQKIKLCALTSGRIIVEQAARLGFLRQTEKKEVLSWLADPPAWSKAQEKKQ